ADRAVVHRQGSPDIHQDAAAVIAGVGEPPARDGQPIDRGRRAGEHLEDPGGVVAADAEDVGPRPGDGAAPLHLLGLLEDRLGSSLPQPGHPGVFSSTSRSRSRARMYRLLAADFASPRTSAVSLFVSSSKCRSTSTSRSMGSMALSASWRRSCISALTAAW